MNRPPSGLMIYWRFKRSIPGRWLFGYVTNVQSGLIRLGRWNGDTYGGSVVEPSEIEWRAYNA